MPVRTNKVLVYVVHGGSLLVFRHVAHPEAGLQVPAGTVEAGEDTAAAALREVREESGLEVRIERCIGTYDFSMAPWGRDEIQHRTVYLARPVTEPAAAWRHWERDANGGGEYEFAFSWHPLEEPIELAGGQGRFLDEVRRVVGAGASPQ